MINNLNITTLKTLISELIYEKAVRDRYIDSVPSDISAAIFDNVYSASLDYSLSKVLSILLPEVLNEDINWFLYDWRPGFKVTLANEVTYVINDLTDYMKYLEEVYFNDTTS